LGVEISIMALKLSTDNRVAHGTHTAPVLCPFSKYSFTAQ